MSAPRIFITGMGIVSPLGIGVEETLTSIKQARCCLKPLQLFSTPQAPLAVGEVDLTDSSGGMPRTHLLAMKAATEAMGQAAGPPDAVIIGVTTGGMTLTEELLEKKEKDSRCYNLHSTSTVAEIVARRFGCKGPVLALSTACASGLAALKVAAEMLRAGHARRVLAGGADALCRLTYYGFHSLQLVDPTGARPFDRMRRGMTVGEGAAMLMLTAADEPPPGTLAEYLGGGLSCDAYHPAAPHPEGEGALRAMTVALDDAGIRPEEIDYLHLHGTGTADNDQAEARAIEHLFGEKSMPFLSSLKGAHGHALAGAGAMGAVISILAVQYGLMPANVGFSAQDPLLIPVPLGRPQTARVKKVCVHAFGFGGNNAVLAFGEPDGHRDSRLVAASAITRQPYFYVHGRSCLSAAGDIEQTMAQLKEGKPVRGIVPDTDILKPLDNRAVRRMKRLSRMVLSLAFSACGNEAARAAPRAIFFGTGWGSLSETYDFISKLFASGERFTSPTDFIGSVHNAPAGHAAIHFGATGPNVTITGGQGTFEQALYCAGLLKQDGPVLLVGADEYHKTLSPLLDVSPSTQAPPGDGGAALYMSSQSSGAICRVNACFAVLADAESACIPAMISSLGGGTGIRERFGLVLAGLPPAEREEAEIKMASFLALTAFTQPVVDYRRLLGDFASTSAVAAVLAVYMVETGQIPAAFCGNDFLGLEGKGILVLGFGRHVTALEVSPW
ncbi:MAG: 3-oxoacyl-ACP synthase [Deltaproteobacteria bacterium]|nr:3-oxoacyl-ACP synthase [Deltaproteobacteria bacterium]